MTDEQREIWELIRASNRAWTSGAPLDVARMFDEAAVMIAPQLASRIEGRDAIVQTYVDYSQHSRTDLFEEAEHSIDVFGDTAVATYRFRVRYRLHGDDSDRDEDGQEILVFRKSAEGWRAVWRTQA